MCMVHGLLAACRIPIGMVVLEMLRWRCPPLLILLVLLLAWIPDLYNGFDLDYVEYMAGAAVVHKQCKLETWHGSLT